MCLNNFLNILEIIIVRDKMVGVLGVGVVAVLISL